MVDDRDRAEGTNWRFVHEASLPGDADHSRTDDLDEFLDGYGRDAEGAMTGDYDRFSAQPRTGGGQASRATPMAPGATSLFRTWWEAPSGLTQGPLVAGLLVAALTLLLSLALLAQIQGLKGEVETLAQGQVALTQQLQEQSRRGGMGSQAQIEEELSALMQRVNVLAQMLEGAQAEQPDGENSGLQALTQRLERLEQSQGVPLVTKALMASDKGDKEAPGVTAKPKPRSEPKVVAPKEGWVINLLTVSSAKTAQEELARMRKLGIRADSQEISKGSKTLYRLRVAGFDSYEGAKAYIDTVERQTGFKKAWVAKQ